jgi:hypothetical protein
VARWYDPYLNRFSQPDTIVPLASQGVQAWDRYAYANNNPVKFKDPSGHGVDCGIGEECVVTQPPQTGTPPPEENGEILDENGWDYVPVVSDVRKIVRGIQVMGVASGQPGFPDQQVALQTWYNNCYGVCHGSSPRPGSPAGGPMPNVPSVDKYSQGMGEAASGATILLTTAATTAVAVNVASSKVQVFSHGGAYWHLGLETKTNMNIIHVGNHPAYGTHIAFGAVRPYVANLHIYLQKALPFFRVWKP